MAKRAVRKRFGRSYLDWLGPEVQERVEKSSMRAIDRTTLQTAEHFRQNHPGWRNITGKAEGSVGTNPARKQKRRIRGNVTGGEGDAFYLLILEVKNGAAIRSASDAEFPHLQQRLHDEYDRAGAA